MQVRALPPILLPHGFDLWSAPAGIGALYAAGGVAQSGQGPTVQLYNEVVIWTPYSSSTVFPPQSRAIRS